MGTQNQNPISQATEEQLRQASIEFSQKMKSYPIDIQVVMPIVMVNTVKGCPWDIASSDDKEFMDHIDDIRRSKNASVFKIAAHNGKGRKDKYLVIADFNTIISVLDRNARGIVSKEDLEKAMTKRQNALKRISEYLEKGRFGAIAIFSTIASSEIIADGRRYPAFDITLTDLISLCKKYKRNFVFGQNSVTPDVLIEMAQKGQIDKVYESLQVAPSENGLFITIDKPAGK